MTRHPLPVMIISAVLIATGLLGVLFHLSDFKNAHLLTYDLVLVTSLRVMAVVVGVYMLFGSNGARWLAMAWIAVHVIVSVVHPIQELVVHIVLFAAFAYGLFRPPSSKYFLERKQPAD